VKTNKKIALVLVIALMLTSLAGCGGGSKSAQESDKIIVGANFEMTGNAASYGNSALQAIKMAFEEINASGGVLGKQIELIEMDNKTDLTESANVAQRLITQNKVVAILGPATSGQVLAASGPATQHKVPLITPTGTAEKVTFDNNQVKEWIFRSCLIDSYQGRVGAEFASKSLNAKKAALLIEMDSDYAKGLAAVFEEVFTANGGTIVAKESFATADKEFRTQLNKIKAANPDVLYVPSYYEQDGLIARQAREVGYTGPIVGGDGWDYAKLAEISGGADVLQNIFFTNHYSVADPTPIVADFVKKYTQKFGYEPDAFAALGYDCAYLLVDAIKRAGAADPAKIRDALASTSGFEGVTGSVTMDEKHNPIKSVVVLTFDETGKTKFVETFQP